VTRGALSARFGPAAWAFADQCGVSACNFLTVYLFAVYMTPVAFGAFAIAQTGLVLMTSIQNALLAQSHNVLGARMEGIEYRRFTSALFLAQIVGGLCLCGLLAAAGLMVGEWYSAAAGRDMLALSFAALPWMCQDLVRRVLYTRGESREALVNDAFSYGLQVVGAVLLVRALGENAHAEPALAVLGGSSLVGVAVGAWQLRGHLAVRGLDRKSLRASLREIWDFGKWLSAQNAVAWLGAQGHAWIIAIMLGAEQLGIYRAVTHLANVLNPIRQAAFVYLPARGSLAYRDGGRAGLARWVRNAFCLLALAPLPLCVALIAFSGPLLSLAYGEKYADASSSLLLVLAVVAQFLTFVKYPYDIGILALGSPRSIFRLYLVPLVLLFTVGVALVHFLGILGVPVSGILINGVLMGATMVAYQRLERGRANPPAAPAAAGRRAPA